MNLQLSQIRYFVTLANTKSYSVAAQLCLVSQPALSMAIKKMEDELGIVLINRMTNPITVTEKGEQIAEKCLLILERFDEIKDLVSSINENANTGELSISVIPTLAPYLVPHILKRFSDVNSGIKLIIEENTTESILHKLKTGTIDAGILATPIEEKSLSYEPIFFEEFFLYSKEKMNKAYIYPEELDTEHLWLLEEGHCMRKQMMKICSLRKPNQMNFTFKAGSIESLINITDSCGGITVIPELTILGMDESKKEHIVRFHPPSPTREISIVYHRYSTKIPLISTIYKQIKADMSSVLQNKDNFEVINIS